MVKEFVNGVALRSLFVGHEGPLPVAIAFYLAQEILTGLDYLHRFQDPSHAGGAKLVHGDLSPSNVMVSFTGEVKLIDLGLSCFPKRALTPTEPVRWLNVRYSSPSRVFSHRRSIDDDLFAFGMIFWAMLVGHPYWDAMENREISQALREFTPRDLFSMRPDLGQDVALLFRSCVFRENFNGYSEASWFAKPSMRSWLRKLRT